MKFFENPIIEVEVIAIDDIITTSGCAEDCLSFSCPTDTGCPTDW